MLLNETYIEFQDTVKHSFNLTVKGNSFYRSASTISNNTAISQLHYAKENTIHTFEGNNIISQSFIDSLCDFCTFKGFANFSVNDFTNSAQNFTIQPDAAGNLTKPFSFKKIFTSESIHINIILQNNNTSFLTFDEFESGPITPSLMLVHFISVIEPMFDNNLFVINYKKNDTMFYYNNGTEIEENDIIYIPMQYYNVSVLGELPMSINLQPPVSGRDNWFAIRPVRSESATPTPTPTTTKTISGSVTPTTTNTTTTTLSPTFSATTTSTLSSTFSASTTPASATSDTATTTKSHSVTTTSTATPTFTTGTATPSITSSTPSPTISVTPSMPGTTGPSPTVTTSPTTTLSLSTLPSAASTESFVSSPSSSSSPSPSITSESSQTPTQSSTQSTTPTPTKLLPVGQKTININDIPSQSNTNKILYIPLPSTSSSVSRNVFYQDQVIIPEFAPSGIEIIVDDPNPDIYYSSNNIQFVSSIVVNINLIDGSNNLGGSVEICFKSNSNSDQVCLGYLDESKNEWVCEDECPDEKNGFYCGKTDHFTNFALLLDGGSNTNSKCSGDNDGLVTGSWYGDLFLAIGCVVFMSLCILIIIISASIPAIDSLIYGTEGRRIRKLRTVQRTTNEMRL